MTINKKILILTNQSDSSSSKVIQWLQYFGADVVRMNGDDNTYKFQGIDSDGVYFQSLETGRTINLLTFSSCWWRRSGFKLRHLGDYSTEVDNLQHKHVVEQLVGRYKKNEAKGLMEYIKYKLYSTIPINLGNPSYDLNRLVVMDMAKELGFNTPNFGVFTKGKDICQFQKTSGQIVTKALENGIYDLMEGCRYYTYTEILSEEFCKKNNDYHFFPSLFMNYIEKEIEIRTFYLDECFYSMAIFSQISDTTKTDYRKGEFIKSAPLRLPAHITKKLRELFKRLALNSGSADLILTKSGEYVFLEINPVGQYAMTSIPCNYNLDKKIAEFLLYDRTENN